MAIQIERKASADVIKRGATRYIYAKQHDFNSRFLNVRIQEDGKDLEVELDSTVILNVKRPDAACNMFEGSVNADGSVTVPLTAWMLAKEGTLICDISIIAKGATSAKLTTMQFNIMIEAAAVGDETVVETEEYSLIIDLLNRADAAAGIASEAAANATQVVQECAGAAESANQAAEEARGVRAEIEAGGFIESMKEMNKGEKFTLWVGTLEEFNKVSPKVNNCYYIITNDPVYQEVATIRSNYESILADIKTCKNQYASLRTDVTGNTNKYENLLTEVNANKTQYVDLSETEFTSVIGGLLQGVSGRPSDPEVGSAAEIRSAARFLDSMIKAFFSANGKPICIRVASNVTVPAKYLNGSSTAQTKNVYRNLYASYDLICRNGTFQGVDFKFTTYHTYPVTISLYCEILSSAEYYYRAIIEHVELYDSDDDGYTDHSEYQCTHTTGVVYTS